MNREDRNGEQKKVYHRGTEDTEGKTIDLRFGLKTACPQCLCGEILYWDFGRYECC